jgi:glycosyltransferase involved in cell wall biosynthesis
MIVKNEEEMLPRCLDSIKWLVDEIIVVDTGSTDKTMDIAREYGAKIYEHPWQNDFSLHRNQSIGYATGDWILIIDADEELMPMGITQEEFKRRLGLLSYPIVALLCIVEEANDVSQWWGSRFFKAGCGFHYENEIHNKPMVNGLVGGTDIKIRHYGYSLSKEKLEIKDNRSITLLHKRLERNPDDYDAHFYLAKYAFSHHRDKDAIEHGTTCMQLLSEIENVRIGYHGQLYSIVGQSYLRLDDPDGSYCWFKKGLELYPEDIDLNYCMAHLGLLTGRTDFIQEHGTKYIDLIGKLNKLQGSNAFRQAMPQVNTSARSINYLHPRYAGFVKQWLTIQG